jgi:hypothetical protein
MIPGLGAPVPDNTLQATFDLLPVERACRCSDVFPFEAA